MVFDKSTWGEGPWLTEMDTATFTDQATQLHCAIVRNNGGALCGAARWPGAFVGQYRDFAYALKQVKLLALQLSQYPSTEGANHA